MAYKLYKAVLDIKTDVSESVIRGDTLFGLICVSILEYDGEDKLKNLLKNYTTKQPFAIVSNSNPLVNENKVAIPLGTVPNSIYNPIVANNNQEVATDRKKIKKLQYVTSDFLSNDYRDWLKNIYVHDDKEQENELIKDINKSSRVKSYSTVGNLINRDSGSPLDGVLFQVKRNSFKSKQVIYICINEDLFTKEELEKHLKAIGNMGYGANKSRGLGKFHVENISEFSWDSHKQANAYITLSSCALTSEDNINTKQSFYSIETIFAKHGNAHAGTTYLKNPLTLINSHALIKPNSFNADNLFIGNGLGGNGNISKTIPDTVHQGYAIVVPIYISEKDMQ